MTDSAGCEYPDRTPFRITRDLTWASEISFGSGSECTVVMHRDAIQSRCHTPVPRVLFGISKCGKSFKLVVYDIRNTRGCTVYNTSTHALEYVMPCDRVVQIGLPWTVKAITPSDIVFVGVSPWGIRVSSDGNAVEAVHPRHPDYPRIKSMDPMVMPDGVFVCSALSGVTPDEGRDRSLLRIGLIGDAGEDAESHARLLSFYSGPEPARSLRSVVHAMHAIASTKSLVFFTVDEPHVLELAQRVRRDDVSIALHTRAVICAARDSRRGAEFASNACDVYTFTDLCGKSDEQYVDYFLRAVDVVVVMRAPRGLASASRVGYVDAIQRRARCAVLCEIPC